MLDAPELAREVPASALAIYAHPDDAEVSCGGTLAAWAREGCRVQVLVATDGGKGCSDPVVDVGGLVTRRVAEMAEAASILGIDGRILLGFPDGEIEEGAELREAIVRVLRDLRPETVICPDPTATFFGQEYVNHRDHRIVGWSALDAVAPASAMPLYFPDAGPPHQVTRLLLSGTLVPDVVVDIGSTLDVKARAVACHRSQLGTSPDWVEAVVRRRAEEAGMGTSVRFAETFRRVFLGS